MTTLVKRPGISALHQKPSLPGRFLLSIVVSQIETQSLWRPPLLLSQKVALPATTKALLLILFHTNLLVSFVIVL